MSRMGKLFLTVSFAVFALIAAQKVARASDYFCDVEFQPGPSQFGPNGYVWASVYTGPGCTGNFVFGAYLCSTGATDPNCAQYEYANLPAMFSVMHNAELANQKIYAFNVISYIFSGFEFMSPGYAY
jgi:hypothetical protein